MKQFYKLFAVVVMFAIMAACDEQIPDLPTPTPTPDSGILFSITATPAGGFTKATDTAFEQGDAVGVFGFKSDLSLWLNNAKFTKAESGFDADKEYYWYEGDEVGRVVGIYPYNADYSGEKLSAEGVEFCVKSDQRTHAGYTASDLMVATKEVVPTEESVVLEFDHLLSKIVIDINNQTSEEISEVMLDGVKGNYTFALSGCQLSGGEGTIKAGKLATASEGYTDTYVLIIPPQTVAPKLVMTTADQMQYTYNADEEVVFGVGKVRHLTVTITEESISTEFDAIVNDWSADEDVEFSQQGGSDTPDTPNTPEEPVVGDMTINPLWSAVYVSEFYDEESGQTYKDLIHIVSTDENSGFFVEFLPEDYYQANVVPDVYGYVKNTADYLVENLKNVNAEQGTEWDFTAYTNYKYGLYDMHWIMNPGKWRAVMWGMTTEGEVTGLYYISDMVEIIDPATPEYKAWLGTYKIVSSDDQGQAVTSMITVSRNVVNESYYIEGWNGIGNAITADFEPTGGEFGNGAIVLYPQTILEDTYIGETHLTKIFFGGIALLEGGYMLFETEDMQIGQAQWLFEDDNSWAGILPYAYQNAEGVVIRASQVGFFGVLDNGNIVGVTNEVHTFREDAGLTMLRQNPEEQPAAVARKRNPLERGNNGAAKRLDEVRRVSQPIGNYVVGGRKFSAINF